MAEDRLIRFQRPQLPRLSDVSEHYALSEEASWFSNGGPCVTRLEQDAARYLGLPTGGAAVSNATAGLMVAMRAIFGPPSGPRRVVAVPSFTFVASINAITWCGYEPLFLDIDPQDWQQSADDLRALAQRESELAGILLCSTFGTAPSARRREEMSDIIASLSTPVVVDSAAGFGAVDDHGRHLGDQGSAEVFSFHATKPFAIGEGGLVTSRDPSLVADVKFLSNFGFDLSRRITRPYGMNAKMSELHGAMGLTVLEDFPRILHQRRTAATWLIGELAKFDVRAQAGHEGSTFQFVSVAMPDHESRERLLRLGPELRIEFRAYFEPPMHEVEIFSAYERVSDLTNTTDLARRVVALPMANDMEGRALERIRDAVIEAVKS